MLAIFTLLKIYLRKFYYSAPKDYSLYVMFLVVTNTSCNVSVLFLKQDYFKKSFLSRL